jgi:hypothetical protein
MGEAFTRFSVDVRSARQHRARRADKLVMRDLWQGGAPAIGGMAGALVVAAVTAAGCAPDTDLYATAGGAGGDPVGGGTAAGVLVDPHAGATDVPVNLAAITVRLPAAIAVAPPPFLLHPSDGAGGDGGAAALGTVTDVACPAAGPAGTCYLVLVTDRLRPSQAYTFEVRSGTTNDDGMAAAAGVIGAFDTAAGADDQPPRVLDQQAIPAGPCLAVRFSTDEPVDAQVVVRWDGGEAAFPAGSGETSFDGAFPLAGLPAGVAADVLLELTDRAGNLTEAVAGSFMLPAATPPLVITEVLANPAGPEPAQEYVELRNVGDGGLSLEGLRIEDSKGGDALPAAELEPGAYALVVPSGYDPTSARDTPPREGTLLVRVDARIGSDGLSNGGEVVRLRMPGGTGAEPIISIYGGWVDVSASAAAGKSVHRLTDDACDLPAAWTQPPRAATPGWGLP